MPLDTPNHYAGYYPPVQPPPQDYPQAPPVQAQVKDRETESRLEEAQSVIQPEGEAPSKDDRQDTHSVQTGTP